MIRQHHVSLVLVVSFLVGCSEERSPDPTTGVDRSGHPSSMPPVRTSDAPSDVRAAYSQFVDALNNQDGDAAAKVTSKRSIDLYSRSGRLALDSSDVDFEELTQVDVFLIFQLRYLLSRRDLEAMNGSDVYCWGVREGLVKKDTVKGITLDKVQVDADVAFATLRKNGQPVKGLAFRFVEEDAEWKFDLLSVVSAVEPTFEGIRKKTGKSKIEFAVYMLEQTYGPPIPPEILAGPLK